MHLALPLPGSVRMVCARCKQCAAAADGSLHRCLGVISGACVWCMFGKTFLALGFCFLFVCLFVCHSNISGTAERNCAKFTQKTCLIPRSDDFECKGQRSRSPGQKNEKLLSYPHWQCIVRSVRLMLHSVADNTIALQPGGDGVTAKHL